MPNASNPVKEVVELVRQLHEVFDDSNELVAMLNSLAEETPFPDSYTLRESATHIYGMYARVKELKKLMPALRKSAKINSPARSTQLRVDSRAIKSPPAQKQKM